jgi:hypothetical protein
MGLAPGHGPQAPKGIVRPSKLEQAGSEFEARLRIARIAGQRPFQMFRSKQKLAVVEQDHAHAVVRVRMPWRDRKRLGISGLGFGPVALSMMNAPEKDEQFRHSGRELKPLSDHRYRFVDPRQREQQEAEFVKGSRIGRSSLRRAPKPGKSIVRASALSQGDGELRLHGWILAGSYCSLERSDGLSWMALQQQRATKQMQRRRMLWNAGEHAAG